MDKQTIRATEVAEAVAQPRSVPVNMYETDKALVVVAPMPGVTRDDVYLRVGTGNLTIEAGLRSSGGDKAYLLHEWDYGPYHRDVAIPSGWGSKIEASFGNGQLAVRLLAGDPPEGGVLATVG